jgi:chromosome segregation ATPase
MAFTVEEQKRHRDSFIHDCHQKAWGAACHANWIGTQLDKLIEDYGKLKEEDAKLVIEINTLAASIDEHTKVNRDKRKALQERRNTLAQQMKALTIAMQEGQRGLNELHQNIEANLQLAKHAETWEWKEVQSTGE